MSVTASSQLTMPDGRKMNVKEITEAYKRAQRYPIVAGATIKRLEHSDWRINVKSTVRNIDKMELENHLDSFVISAKSLQVNHIHSTLKNASILAEDERAGNRVVLETEKKDDKSVFWVSLYQQNVLEKSIKLVDFDVHGPVVMKEPFAAFSLSKDASKVLYIANRKQPTYKSFFEKDRKAEKTENPLGGENSLQESWGEQYTEIFSTVVCVLDLQKETVQVIEKQNHSLASPFWIGNDEIGFVAINELPRKLGRVFCPNRQSSLWRRKLSDTQSTLLAGDGDEVASGEVCEKSVIHSPVINPSASQVIFLQNAMGGAHMKASQVILLDLETQSKKVLCGLDLALYIDALPKKCWRGDGLVLFSSSSHGAIVLWQIDVKTGSLVRIASPLPSVNLLAVDEDLAVIVASSFAHVPQVFACQVDSSFDVSNPKWTPVTKKIEIEGISIESGTVAENVQAFLVSPKNLVNEAAPCILAIHGGPHSSYVNTFLGSIVFFTSLGFKLLIPNYRGSIGVDESTLNSLPGNVGTNDVSDCIEATNFYIKKGLVKPDELFLWGGSHGGFLVCHLAGQHPQFNWVALATRNPVVDMASMVQMTDIPDWCWFETFGGDQYFTQVLDEQVVAKMFSMSPFKHVSRVKTPSLVLLGSEDLRVPMSGALRWHEELKRAGVPTKCHVYADNHGLAKVPVDADCLVNSVIWYLQHLENKRLTERP